ncbi:MAG: SRPBCC domain-containing protein, partial [Pseudomonadota bacterium]
DFRLVQHCQFDEIDLRVGGAYRYVWENLDGTRMGTGGLYREILSPERILQTEKYDDNWTGGETLNTATLTPIGDATRLTTTVVYPSREMRDAAVQSPMESGITIGYDRLDTVLAAVQQEQAQ